VAIPPHGCRVDLLHGKVSPKRGSEGLRAVEGDPVFNKAPWGSSVAAFRVRIGSGRLMTIMTGYFAAEAVSPDAYSRGSSWFQFRRRASWRDHKDLGACGRALVVAGRRAHEDRDLSGRSARAAGPRVARRRPDRAADQLPVEEQASLKLRIMRHRIGGPPAVSQPRPGAACVRVDMLPPLGGPDPAGKVTLHWLEPEFVDYLRAAGFQFDLI
jgi:hypothetical protein